MSYFSKMFRGTIGTTIQREIGVVKTINSQAVKVLSEDAAGDIVKCSGAFAITDAGAGYAKGCMHTKTDGGVATTAYVNEGTNASCDFNAIT